jgi:hypothetical protein
MGVAASRNLGLLNATRLSARGAVCGQGHDAERGNQ